MPPRLSHKKSRLGCKRCKIRRVKCDETHPSCSNCSRHNVPCEYESPPVAVQPKGPRGRGPPTARDVVQQPSTEGYPTPDEAPYALPPASCGPVWPPEYDMALQDSPNQRRHVELRLLHHFTSNVTFTFPSANDQGLQEMWCVDAVHLGFRFEFLLNAIFATAALHLIRGIPPSPRFYVKPETSRAFKAVMSTMTPPPLGYDEVKAHRFYLDLAVQQQREAAAHISPDNCNALFFASILLGFQALSLPGRDEELMSGRYFPPSRWLRMTIAIREISDATIHLFKPTKNVAQYLGDIGVPPNFRDHSAIYNPENAFVFAELLDWEKHPEPDLDEDIKYLYKRTLYYIGGVYRAIREQEPLPHTFVRILSFAPMIPTGFIDLVEHERPRALAILALQCALLKAVDDHWVFHGLADREVRGIQSIMPPEWQWAIEKPMSLLEQLAPA